jgi:immunity protein 52 of polymorphic toxin system
VLIAVGQSWDVNWGTVEPWNYDLQPRDAEGHLIRPWGGWLTYLSPSFAGKVTPAPAAVTERLSDDGILVAVTKDQFDPSNPSQVVVYNAIQACLRPLQT